MIDPHQGKCVMRSIIRLFVTPLLFLLLGCSHAEDPYKFFTWNVTWGTISPLGVPQKGILINGMFPGPDVSVVTNNNIDVSVINNLDEHLLFTWHGVQLRRNSWQDGVIGTNCRIPPGKNFTYKFQVKDQIGTFFYYPSTYYHRAAGGFGGLYINSRDLIPVPFDPPAAEFTFLIGDWYKTSHSILRRILDSGRPLPPPDGILINGQAAPRLDVTAGKVYRLRIVNVGLSSSLNVRIQGHTMLLVEAEGTHTKQNSYDSLDIHVGQSCSVLVTADQTPKDYSIIVNSRFSFSNVTMNATATLHYSDSQGVASDVRFPPSPPDTGDAADIEWSMNQAKSIRTNLTASAARPNPQGSYHYGKINITRTILLQNSVEYFQGKLRYAVNGVSFKRVATPLKLADYFNISGVFTLDSIPDHPSNSSAAQLGVSVLKADYRKFVEIVLVNKESSLQTWHLDGYSFFVVGMGIGEWSNESRSSYNNFDAVSRSTVEVYPHGWTAILLSLDNVGMWNVRSTLWDRQYLGQQLYIRIRPNTAIVDRRDELPPPHNVLLCGLARSHGQQSSAAAPSPAND